MNPREQAIKYIKEGHSVAVYVEGELKQFSLENLADLPPLEAFVAGNPEAEQAVISELRKEKEELEKRLAALGETIEPKVEAKVEETKTEEPKTEEKAEEKKAEETKPEVKENKKG